jgi:hypothetical protein
MSEAANLNSDPNFERMLRELEPQRLEVSRDELFFQAGFAAGVKNRSRRFFWPAIAAALLVACGGMAAFGLRQRAALQTALAIAEQRPSTGGTAGSPSSGEPSAISDAHTAGRASSGTPTWLDNTLIGSNKLASDERLRDFRRLISPAPLPPGRLTAGGWQEARAEMGNVGGRPDRSEENESLPPRRPATYLELLHRYQEG